MPKRRAVRNDPESPPRAKRRRHVEEEEDLDEIQPDYSRAAAVRRPAAAAQVEEEEHEEQEHDEGGGMDESDDESAGDLDEDEDEQMRLTAQHGFATFGILHSVRVDRFMCHDCFTYPLGPNVNIIHGKNGSGKSAIVAALQIGLLASPNVTERGKKLEEFIKHGEDSCVITVKILNRKPIETEDENCAEADLTYKHDVYGDVIVIERRIYRGAGRAGSFSVKGRNNRHAKLAPGTTARQEVQAIVDHFGFMVDNPVAILTQTKSKEFLAKGKPPDHYRLYRRATLLGPLEDELVETEKVTNEVVLMLRHKEDQLPEVEARLEKKEAAHKEAQEMKNIDALIDEAKRRLAWTLVQEQEIRLQRYEDRTINEFEPKAEQARLAADESRRKLDGLEEELKQHSESLKAAVDKSRMVGINLRESEKKSKTAELDMERYKRRIQEFDAEVASLQSRIDRTRTKMEQAREAHFAGQEQKSALVHELKDSDARIQELNKRMAGASEREAALHEEKLSLQEDLARISATTERLRRDFEGKRREQMRVASTARNRDDLARFGEVAPELVRKIRQNARKFHRPPVGPIGHYVKMKDESWAAAVEMAVGRGTLRSYIVHDGHDASLLESLIPRTNHRPSIVVCNVDRERYDVRPSDMPDVGSYGHHTILDMVQIENNAVFNSLLDQAQIERNVLNGKDDDITQLGWSRMPNLFTVWNKRCDRAYTRNGSNTFRKGPQNVNAFMLTKDMRPYLANLEREVQGLEREVADHERQGGDISRKIRENGSAARDVRREIQGTQLQINEIRTRKTQLEDQLDRAENAFDPEPFEVEIASYENNIKDQIKHRSHSESQIQAAKDLMQNAASDVEQAKATVREANAETQRHKKTVERASEQVARVKSRDRELRRQNEAAASLLAQAQQEVNQQKGKVAEHMEMAREVGECPTDVDPAKMPSSKCEQSVKMLERRLQTEQQRRGGRSANEIEMDFLLAQRKYRENQEVLGRIQYYVKALNRGIKNRKLKLSRLNKALKQMVRANFKKFAGTRGHRGSVTFKTNNGVRELHLVAQMATHRKKDGELYETRDMKALSGGEKSYLTLSFILALAELCQNPVRVMDEIDVFQDEASRRASFKTTVQFFNKWLSNRQIIIITPLALPGIEATEQTRILEMPDPRDENEGGRQTRISDFMST